MKGMETLGIKNGASETLATNGTPNIQLLPKEIALDFDDLCKNVLIGKKKKYAG